ncbi:MAG: FAD-binding protein, partial [Candidatus Methanosuratus sp.]|nr:FAD-binding protein [Candidatus Methanosuratincola sp.]
PAATPTPQVIKETVEVPVEVTREVIKEVEVTKEVVKEVEAQPWLPEKWDKEADVVVVGYGLAGASAAIHAHDAGAKVLILEKMPQGREGGNSKVSGNLVFIPGNVEDGKTYFKAMAEGHLNDMPEELIQAWAEEMVANREWLESIGIDPLPMPPALGMSPELPHLPGSETMVIYSMGGKLGNAALWDPVVEEVTSRGIEILYETPGKKLVATCEGEVVGLIAESGGNEIAIKAKKAVILTCGGMEFDETMKANYLAAPCYSVGTPGNTGDGIRMAQAVGADLWHMNNFMGPISTGFFVEGLDPELANIPVWGSMPGQSYIYVDKYGKRFMNETRPSDHGHGWHEINYYDGN